MRARTTPATHTLQPGPWGPRAALLLCLYCQRSTTAAAKGRPSLLPASCPELAEELGMAEASPSPTAWEESSPEPRASELGEAQQREPPERRWALSYRTRDPLTCWFSIQKARSSGCKDRCLRAESREGNNARSVPGFPSAVVTNCHNRVTDRHRYFLCHSSRNQTSRA